MAKFVERLWVVKEPPNVPVSSATGKLNVDAPLLSIAGHSLDSGLVEIASAFACFCGRERCSEHHVDRFTLSGTGTFVVHV